jgi:predicted 3-demethylubiquinone-9 3-methyltransferase (glyoxalase superfamily)
VSPAKPSKAKRPVAAKPKTAAPTRVPAIHPFLWLPQGQVLEAAAFYCSVFPGAVNHAKGAKGDVLTADLTLGDLRVTLLTGRPGLAPNEANSLHVDCKDQAEVDYYWSRLLADGGEESRCGWLKDKYGFSWQVVPRQLTAALTHKDPAKAKRAMKAMFTMRKIDIAAIEAAVR